MSKTSETMATAMVSTATGARLATSLGVTLPHEHVIHRISNFSGRDDNTCVDIDLVARELVRYRAAGGGAICDVTPIGVGRDPRALREVSLRSGVPIVSGVGVYDITTYPQVLAHASRRQWADFLVAEILGGESGIQAGIIGEIASHNESHADWRKYRLLAPEETVFRAVADAQRQTGLFISTHASFGRQGVAQLRTLIDAGADPHKVVIGHCDAMAHPDGLGRDMEYFHWLLERRAWLEFDMFGWTELLSDELRFERVAALANQGFSDRLLISMDICRRSQLRENNGRGFGYLFTHVIPGLRRWGLSEATIHRMVTENPQRVLGEPCSVGGAPPEPKPNRAADHHHLAASAIDCQTGG